MNMSTHVIGLAVVLVVASVASVSNGDETNRAQRDAERYILAGEAAWADSVATNDASVVKRILADDVIWVLNGKILDKRAAVEGAEKGPYDFVSDRLEYAHVRFFGDTAVVQGSEAWERKGGRKGRFVWTDTWLRRNGQWQIVAAEDVSIPAN